MHYIGLDIGGTSVKAGLVDETGRVLESRRALTPADDLYSFLATLTELVREFQTTASVEAIGVGVPGLRSSRTHIIETSPNIRYLKRINLEELLPNQVHIRTVTENDANAAAYAEFVCGAAVGLQQVAHLTLGTGLGSGLIVNGSLFTGTSGYAGEFGHTVLSVTPPARHTDRVCSCGNTGCVETFISATGIVITAEKKMSESPESVLHRIPAPLTSEKVYQAAIHGDATAQSVFMETGVYLGIACANLINLLNLDMIVISGGVMGAGELLLEPARQAAKLHAFPSSYADCRIVQSTLWPDAGVIGAAMIARDR